MNTVPEPAVLAVDIGTTSLKAALITKSGACLATSRRGFLLHNTEHASEEWLPALRDALAAMLPGVSAGRGIAALCVSGNGPTVVAETGETLLWNEEGVELEGPSLFLPRLVTHKNKFPEAWEKSSLIFGAPEYFLWLLTDKACTILPARSFADVYWDGRALEGALFSREEAAKLPPFMESAQRLGGLSQKAASFLGAQDAGVTAGLPVFCGAPDFVSALVGTGTVESGVLCDRAGSSEGLNFCTRERIAGDGIRTLPSVIEGLWNASVLNTPDGRANESGARFEEFKLKYERETLSPIAYDDLVFRLITSDGTDATLDRGKYLMIQIALNLKGACARLKCEAAKLGIAFPEVMRVSGGQAKCALWNQMKADITNMAIEVPAVPDAELAGDAAFAFTGLGLFPNIQAAARALYRADSVYYPNGEPPVTIQY